MPKLSIVMYEPVEGKHEHCALSLDEGKDKKLVFEVVGEHPNFEAHALVVDPRASGRFERRYSLVL